MSDDLYVFPRDFVIFDLETDGTPEHNIIEIGAIRVSHDFKIQAQFQELVGGHIIAEAGHDHMKGSITDEMLAGTSEEPVYTFEGGVGARFADWCGRKSDYILTAWGAQFDANVLRNEWSRLGIKYPHPGAAFCIKSVAWWETVFMPRQTSSMAGLQSICTKLGLEFEGTPHRALDDARMEARVMIELKSQRMAQIT